MWRSNSNINAGGPKRMLTTIMSETTVDPTVAEEEKGPKEMLLGDNLKRLVFLISYTLTFSRKYFNTTSNKT